MGGTNQYSDLAEQQKKGKVKVRCLWNLSIVHDSCICVGLSGCCVRHSLLPTGTCMHTHHLLLTERDATSWVLLHHYLANGVVGAGAQLGAVVGLTCCMYRLFHVMDGLAEKACCCVAGGAVLQGIGIYSLMRTAYSSKGI